MTISRRKFLKDMLLLGTSACSAAAFGPLGSRYAFANSAGGNGNSLVLFNQFGGCDPLNSFAVPHLTPEYYQKRQSIALPQDAVLPVADGQIAFHPSLSSLKRLFDSGNCAVIRGIGDPVGTRSHFTSQDIFSRGITESAASDGRGWLGRLGDLYFEEQQFNTIGISVGAKLDFNSNREKNIPLVLQSLENFSYRNSRVEGLSYIGENNLKRQALKELTIGHEKDSNFIKSKVDLAQEINQSASSVIQKAFEVYTPEGTYEDNPASQFFKEVITTLNSELGTKVFYGGTGGWDHHSDQGGIEGSQAALLAGIDQGLAAYETDAKKLGVWDKTCICIFTEFGRKTFENGSGGTDHGWGSAMVLIGGNVNGGLYGPATTSEDFNEDWLGQHIDFRNPFSEMISWLGFNPEPVFPESYKKEKLGLLGA